MDYGKIVSGTFGVIWKEKKLWLFGVIGLLLGALASGLYLAWYFNWYGDFLSSLVSLEYIESDDPVVILETLMGSMSWLFGGMSFMFCVSIIGYIINLVMRGGTISEADLAWEGESVDIGRGARNGAGHGLHLFIVDLLWWLVPAVLMFAGIACGVLFLFGGIGAAVNAPSEQDAGAIFAIMGSVFTMICVLGCLGLLITVLQGIFAPLMYQSVVLGKRSIGAAISEGFSLARHNIGPMVIFLIIIFVLNLGVQFLIQMASLPLMGGWMVGWVGMIQDLSQGGMPSPSGANGVVLFFGGLLVALATLLGQSFMQTFSLTLYARVYRLLTPQESTDVDTPQLPTGDRPAQAVVE